MKRICDSAALPDGGDGVRFEVRWQGENAQAFAIRHEGLVRAYLNRCAHVPVELDWQPGRFLDAEGVYLICATHGAIYVPETGYCVGGPCKGKSLQALTVVERDGGVYLDGEQA